MDKVNKSCLLAGAGLLILVPALSLMSAGRANAEDTKEVVVVNRPTQPIPTTVQNMPPVTGSVSIINTPSVNVTNMPSVNLVPGASVGLTPGTSVSISGTVGLAPGTSVGISGTPTVHLDNPIPGSGTPFLLTGSGSANASFGLGFFSADPIPLGKLFVIDLVNCIVKTSPPGGRVILQLQTALPGGKQAVMWLPAPTATPVLGSDFNVINQFVRTFAVFSSQVGFGFQFDSALDADASCTVAGTLIDNP